MAEVRCSVRPASSLFLNVVRSISKNQRPSDVTEVKYKKRLDCIIRTSNLQIESNLIIPSKKKINEF